MVGSRSGGDLPTYEELPRDHFGTRSGWGLFGTTDSTGLIGFQTPDRVRDAARLVRTGRVFSLNADLGLIDPPFFRREKLRHRLISYQSNDAFDDAVDNMFLQASSQWDALAHAAYAPGIFYNGATASDIADRRRNTVDHWSRRGIAGGAVLLDVETILGGAGGFDPSSSLAITVPQLEEARLIAGIDYQPGDVLLVQTGYLAWYRTQEPDARREWSGDRPRAVGLEHSENMARYLWNAHVCAVASDNPAVEVWPPDRDPSR
jgi:hypothetical protein